MVIRGLPLHCLLVAKYVTLFIQTERNVADKKPGFFFQAIAKLFFILSRSIMPFGIKLYFQYLF